MNTNRGTAQTHCRAGGEAQGRIRWLRPAFQNPQELLSNKELLPHVQRALSADLVQGNQYQIDSAPGPWKKGLPLLLQTLEALGRAQQVALGAEAG